jgi:WD40 repeat protein
MIDVLCGFRNFDSLLLACIVTGIASSRIAMNLESQQNMPPQPSRHGYRIIGVTLLFIIVIAIAIASWIWWSNPIAHSHSFPDDVNTVVAMSFSPDDAILAAASTDRTILLWKLKDKELLRRITPHRGPILTMAFLEIRKLMVLFANGDVGLWDVTTGVECDHWQLRTAIRDIVAACIHPGTNTLGLAASNHSIQVVKLDRDTHSLSEYRTSYPPRSLLFSKDGTILGIGGLWEQDQPSAIDLQAKKLIQIDPVHAEWNALAIVGETNAIATGHGDGSVNLWDLATGHETFALPNPHHHPIFALASDRDGILLAAGDDAGRITLWNTQSRQCLRSMQVADAAIHLLVFSNDGQWLASACIDIGFDDREGHGKVTLWRIRKTR